MVGNILFDLFVLLVCAIAFVLVGIFSFPNIKAVKYARWLWNGEKAQFDPLCEDVLDIVIEFSEDDNEKSELFRYLKVIRSTIGHRNLKMGHLDWIYDQIDNKIPAEEQTTIPTFCIGNSAPVPVQGK